MTASSDSSADSAFPQELFQRSRSLDARLHHDIMRYYSGKFKYHVLGDLLRAQYPNPGDVPDFLQEREDAQYPTLAQYLAYLCRLNVTDASLQAADEPDQTNSSDLH